MGDGKDRTDGLLTLARDAVRSALRVLGECSLGAHQFAKDLPRELKAEADRAVERDILSHLRGTKLEILSEEIGNVMGETDDGFRWVVDPIDGTVNFVRGLGPCAVSIALCRENEPVFGVIGEYPSGRVAWGGAGLGAFLNDAPIRVSQTPSKSTAVICTGFPSRFEVSNERATATFLGMAGEFAKVRMLGTAALSLVHVARGSADVYFEKEIMFWDVAAGLALVEGAGGIVQVVPGEKTNALNVFASNGLLRSSIGEIA